MEGKMCSFPNEEWKPCDSSCKYYHTCTRKKGWERKPVQSVQYKLTEEMKKDRLNCGENADCNECSCQIGIDDCIYNYFTTVADRIRGMENDILAVYLFSWQGESMSLQEIKDLLNSEARK